MNEKFGYMMCAILSVPILVAVFFADHYWVSVPAAAIAIVSTVLIVKLAEPA